MSIKKSSVNDVQAIMKLVHQAQLYFKNNGIDQWQDGYPKDENIYSDIDKGHSYVLFQNNIIIKKAYEKIIFINILCTMHNFNFSFSR